MASRKFTGSEYTIVVGGNTYKRSFIKFVKNLSFFAAFVGFLMIPAAPFMLILSLFFGFLGFKYNKVLKAPVPSRQSIASDSFQEELTPCSSSDSSALDEVLNVHLPKGKSARIKFFVTGTRHENREHIIKEFLINNAHNAGSPFLDLSDSEIIELNRTVYEYYYDALNGPLRLEPEPDNKFDKNAIKVMLDDKVIGCVPAVDCERVHKFISSNEYDIWWQVRGGISKFYPGYGEKVRKENQEAGVQVKLFKK